MRPNKKDTADKRMDEIDVDLRSKVPVILRKGLQRVEDIMNDKKSSDSSVLRGVEAMYKILKELKQEDIEVGVRSPSDKEDSEPAPVISLKVIEK